MAEPNVRPAVGHLQGAPDEERAQVEMVMAHALSFEDGIGREFRERCNRFYRQFRGFRKFRDVWTKTSRNDKDEVLHDAKKHWGSQLHIPLSFRTIETMVPRAIAHRPRMLYLPRQERWEENVRSIRLLIDSQQEQIDIDLAFQAVMRSGRIYGLGIGKDYWLKRYSTYRPIQRAMFNPSKYVAAPELAERCTFNDPMFEDVDPFDFMWDPYGSDMRTCEWAIHRTWLSTKQVVQRITTGQWGTVSAQMLQEEDIRRLGGSERWDETWNERMEASGFSSFNHAQRGEQPHELLEWHDGERVVHVLDRSVLVAEGESPCVGYMPFQVYRPTPLQKQMVGIGDLEPLEHLQRELDALRSQRRDAATLALAPGWVFDDGMIEEDDLEMGPAAAIRVTNGRPSDAIMPIPAPQVPGTSYQEEQVVRQDFDVVSGISDALNPDQGGNIGTATEAQLVQASLSARIELGSRRFEIEVVKNSARCFLHLNQRMILEERQIRTRDENQETPPPEGRWTWFPVGPQELQGEFEIICEGGSMAARNIPQERQDGMQLMQMFNGNPHIDQRRVLTEVIKKFGYEDPGSWLAQQPQPIPPETLDILVQGGVHPSLVQFAVQEAQRANPLLPTPEPDVQQVDQAMGAPQ